MNNAHAKVDHLRGGHTLLVDERGDGQELLIAGTIRAQIAAGGAVVIVGPSINDALLEAMIESSQLVGRGSDIMVVNPAKPATSHTYNPVLHTAPAKVASHVLNFIADQEAEGIQNPLITGALLEAIVSSLQLLGVPYSFLDLGMFVMKPDAITALADHMTIEYPSSSELQALTQAIGAFHDREGGLSSDLLKEQFSGLAGSMCMMGSGRAGEVFNSYKPDVVLHEALSAGKIIYLAIPYVGRGSAAANLRRIVISNLSEAIDRISALPCSIPALAVFTDAGGCNAPAIEQLLSAEKEPIMNVWVSAGSLDDLGRESLDLRETCISKARSIVFFKPASLKSVDLYLKFLPQEDANQEARDRLLVLSSSEFVAVSAGHPLHWGDARTAMTLSSVRGAPVILERPVRHYHAPLSGADKFTQTMPV